MKTKAFKMMATLFVAALSLGFSSCGGDDDTGDNPVSTKNPFIGTWHRYFTNIYVKDKYSVRWTFEKDGKGLHYYLPVEIKMGLGGGEPDFENNQEFNYTVEPNDNGKFTLTIYYTNNSKKGKSETFEDVYVLGDALFLGGEMYERVVINN